MQVALEQQRKEAMKKSAAKELHDAMLELAKELMWKKDPTPAEERFLQAAVTFAMASS